MLIEKAYPIDICELREVSKARMMRRIMYDITRPYLQINMKPSQSSGGSIDKVMI